MYGTCRDATEVSLLKEDGTQTLETYIDKEKVTVAEWVALRPIIEVCDMETGYEGGGERRETWWHKSASHK